MAANATEKHIDCSLIQPYYPSLDGIRASAFLAVFFFHYSSELGNAGQRMFRWGWVGVDMFFVLSGFLITGILYNALHKPDYFRTFYTRRALRIFPLYYGVLLGLVFLTPLLKIAWTRYNLLNFLYLANFSMWGPHQAGQLQFTLPFVGRADTLSLSHFWTLSVEEQFYMIWPVVIWLVRSRRSLLSVCLAAIVASPFLRAVTYFHNPQDIVAKNLYVFTFFRVDALLAGAAVALWLRGDPMPVPDIRRLARWVAIGCPALLAVLCSLWSTKAVDVTAREPIVFTIGFTLIDLSAAALLILALDSSSLIAKVMSRPSLVSMGRMSYGLYIFHYLGFPLSLSLAAKLAHFHLYRLAPFICFVLTYIAAWLSYRYYETPFLHLKDRLSRQTRHTKDEPISMPLHATEQV